MTVTAPPAPQPAPPATTPAGRLRAVTGGPLARIAGSSVLGTGVGAAAGFAFWNVAARMSSPAAVGQATAVTSAMAVVALLGAQTLSTTLLGRLPRRPAGEQRALLGAALRLAVPAAAVLAVLAVAGAPLLSANLAVLHRPLVAALLVAGSALTAAGLVTDAAAVAVRRSGIGLVRNSVHAVGKLALLPVLLSPVVGVGGLAGVLAAWVLLLGAAVAVSGVQLHRALPPAEAGWRSAVRTVTHGSAAQTVAVLGGALPPQLMPVLVFALAGPVAAGYFGVAWLIGSVCFTISPAVANGLLSEGARDPQAVAATTRRAARLTAALLTVPVVVLAAAGQLPLALFGGAYAAHGRLLLVLLAVSALPDAVTNLGVALLRIAERLPAAAVVNAGIGLLAVGGTAALVPVLGADGAGVAWLAAQTVLALALPAVLRRVPQRPTPAR